MDKEKDEWTYKNGQITAEIHEWIYRDGWMND